MIDDFQSNYAWRKPSLESFFPWKDSLQNNLQTNHFNKHVTG